MATFEQRPRVTFSASMVLTEGEARALTVLTSYSCAEIVSRMGLLCGSSLTEEHRADLLKFLTSARDGLGPIVSRADDAGAVFHGQPRKPSHMQRHPLPSDPVPVAP